MWLYRRNLGLRGNEEPQSRKIPIFFSHVIYAKGAKEKFEFEKKGHYSCITEICDGMGVRDPEVGQI